MMDIKTAIKKFLARRKNQNHRRKSSKPLIENDMQDGYDYENPLANNAFSMNGEHFPRRYQPGYYRPVQPNPQQQNSKEDISKLVSDSFPKPPAELDQNLKQHLSDVKKALSDKLTLISGERNGSLVHRCHHQMFAHLHNLLQNISWFTNCLLLMNWVSQTYLSEDLLGSPDQQLLDKWEAEAKLKLCESLKKEISESLHKILQTHKSQKCHDEETYVGLYVDVIQCVNGKLQSVRDISSASYDEVSVICDEELLQFVKRYATEQNVLFSKEVQTWKERNEKIETILFLKTIKTCKELRKYVQPFVLKETVEILENLETSTLNFLKEILADMAERGVENYFKSGRCDKLQLETLNTHFPVLSYVLDEQRTVMNEAYKIFAHTYLEHLIKKRCNSRKLRAWKSDAGIKIQLDANYLHQTFSDLAPGVQRWNLMLMTIPEVIRSKDIEGLKLTLAQFQKDCAEHSVCSEDLLLLPALLRWKGLSKRKVREVLEALPGGPRPGDSVMGKTIPSSGSPFSCLICSC